MTLRDVARQKPTILEVVSKYVDLRRSGKEHLGLCPFHSEKTPSFTVNAEKGVFYCFACAEGGDLITFIEKAEGLGFKDALAHLGVEDTPRRGKEDQVARNEAAEIVTWAMDMSERVAGKLRQLGHQQRFIREFADKDLAAWKLQSLKRQWKLLSIIDEDLADPNSLVEFWKRRHIIEGLLAL